MRLSKMMWNQNGSLFPRYIVFLVILCINYPDLNITGRFQTVIVHLWGMLVFTVAEEARLIAEQEEQERLEREQKEEEERLRLELKVRSSFLKFSGARWKCRALQSATGLKSGLWNNLINVFICDRTGSAERMNWMNCASCWRKTRQKWTCGKLQPGKKLK